MKRFVAFCAAMAMLSVTTLGCQDKAKTERQETVTSPGGTTTTTDTHEVKSSGENPPPNASGETAK